MTVFAHWVIDDFDPDISNSLISRVGPLIADGTAVALDTESAYMNRQNGDPVLTVEVNAPSTGFVVSNQDVSNAMVPTGISRIKTYEVIAKLGDPVYIFNQDLNQETELRIEGRNSVRLLYNDEDFPTVELDIGFFDIDDDLYHHFVIALDCSGSTIVMSVWVDGVFIDSESGDYDVGVMPDSQFSAPLQFFGSAGGGTINGGMAEMMVYDSVLTEEQILARSFYMRAINAQQTP